MILPNNKNTTFGIDEFIRERGHEGKFLVMVETASMNESKLGAYAQEKARFVEQIWAWREI